MCEFLVSNKEHWSVLVDKTNWTLEKIRFMEASAQKEDLIACRKDNTYKDSGRFNPNFHVIRVPEMNITEGYTYIAEIYGNEGDTHLVRKCKFKITTTKQFQTLTKAQFLSLVKDKIDGPILILERDF